MKSSERYQVSVPIEFKSDNSVAHKALLSNIGVNGMCFNSIKHVTEGKDVAVTIQKNAAVLETKGTVVWCKKHPRSYAVGVKFSKELNPADIATLAE
jgi:hypothetical protein